MEYTEENMTTEIQEDIKKLLKTARIRSIVFWMMFIFITIMTVVLAHEPLYFFNFLEPDPNIPLSGQIFRFGFYVFVVLAFIYLSWFSIRVYGREIANNFESEEKAEQFKKQYSLFDLLMVVPLFLIFIIIVNGIFFGFAYVDGESMLPAYEDGEFVVIEHFDACYEVGDVIIIQKTNKLIKRVVGIAGDELVVDATGVYVDNILIEDDINPGYYYAYSGIIPEGFLYVLGDNRNDSTDSRYFGLIREDQVIGKVIYPQRPLD